MEVALPEELQEEIKLKSISPSDLTDFDDFEKRVDLANQYIANIRSGIKNEALDDAIEGLVIPNKIDKVEKDDDQNKKSSAVDIATDLKKTSPTSKVNKTTINTSNSNQKSAELTNMNDTMSQEAFMKFVEADADKRCKERMERNKKSHHLMLEGNKAFKDGRYEKALSLYNQAIDVRRDNSVLFVNRALTLLRLGLYTKACCDCDAALKLKESLKPRLYKGRALFEMADEKAAAEWMAETKHLYPKRLTTIEDYIADWQKGEEAALA